MSKRIVFMFSGQGSQYYHMGAELFLKHPVFRHWMQKLDAVAVQIMGESVISVLYDERKRKDESFDRLIYTHPAIFMTEYALTQVFLESGIMPDYVLGASMGEFVAAGIVGVMEYTELMECVIRHAEVIESHCPPGGMIAVIHSAALYHQNSVIRENSELAAVNYDSHFVVAGYQAKLEAVKNLLKADNILNQALPVQFGFHSSAIEPAANAYRSFLSRKAYARPQIPFLSCAECLFLQQISADHFWNVTRQPMYFRKAVETLEAEGDIVYLDLGPTGTMANFAKYSLPKGQPVRIYSAMTPFSSNLASVEAAITSLNKL